MEKSLKNFCEFFLMFMLGHSSSHAFFSDFETQPADVIPHGQMHLGMRAEYYQNQNNYDFPLNGNLLNAPVLIFMTGFGNKVDFYVDWQFEKFIFNDATYGTRDGMGDPRFFIKINLLKEYPPWPGIAFRLGAKEPAALNPFGTDEADIFGTWLFSKTFSPRLTLHANVGVSVLGDRARNATQKDAFHYGGLIETRLSEALKVGLEYVGEYKVQSQWYKVWLYDEDAFNRSHLRLGVLTHWGSWDINTHLSLGLIDPSESWGTWLGFYYQGQAFN